jgi:hypothetical protein
MSHWIIEKTGDERQVWGPYETAQAARSQCGSRHVVVCGRGLENGLVLTRGAVSAKVQAGTLWVPGGDSSVLA